MTTFEQIKADVEKLYKECPMPNVTNLTAVEKDGIVYIFDGDSLFGMCSREAFDELGLVIVRNQ